MGCPQGLLLAHCNGVQNTLQLSSRVVQTWLNTVLKQMSSFIIIQMQQNNNVFLRFSIKGFFGSYYTDFCYCHKQE